MKICILSDSHDQIPLLDAAAGQAPALGAEAVIDCADLVAPSTLQCLEQYGVPVHLIHDKNTGDRYTLGRLAARPGG
jgi:predicted phosphodiesterase